MLPGGDSVLRSISADGASKGRRAIIIDADDTAFLWQSKEFNTNLSDMVGTAKPGDIVYITSARTRQYFLGVLKQALRRYIEGEEANNIRLSAMTISAETNFDTLTVDQLTAAWEALGWNWRDATLTSIKAHIAEMVAAGVEVVVSTPYDHVRDQEIGSGFDEIIAPFEADLVSREIHSTPAKISDEDSEVTHAIRRDGQYSQYLFLLERTSPFPVRIECFDDLPANLASFHAACMSHYSRHNALDFSWDTLEVNADGGGTKAFTPTVQIFIPHNLSSSGANTTLVDRAEQARCLHGAMTVIAAMRPPSGVEGEFFRVGAPVAVLPSMGELTAADLLPCALLPLPPSMVSTRIQGQIAAARIVCNSLMSYPAASLLLELEQKGLLAPEQIGMIAHEYYQPDPSFGRAISATPNEALLRSPDSGFNPIFKELGDRVLMVAEMQQGHYGFGTVLRNGFQKALWDTLLAEERVQARARAHMAKLGLTENSVLIMTTGIISQRKGQVIIPQVAHTVLLSMASAPDLWEARGYDNVVFLMVGERHIGRPDEEETNRSIERDIIAYDLAGKVVKWPAVPQEQLAEYYAMLRMVGRAIAWQTSKCEVMPVSVVEMVNAGGLPVVTAAGATAELIPATYQLRLLTTPGLLCQQAAALERVLLLDQESFEEERDEVCGHALAEFDMATCEAAHHDMRCKAASAVSDKAARAAEQEAYMAEQRRVAVTFRHPSELVRKPAPAATPVTVPEESKQPDPVVLSKPGTVTLPFFGEVSQKTFNRGVSLACVGAMFAFAALGNKGSAKSASDALSFDLRQV